MSLTTVLLLAGSAVLAAAIMMYVFARRGAPSKRTAAGLEVVRALRWKEFAQLVTRSFENRGYRVDDLFKKPGDGGVDYTLLHGNARHLLSIKHGGAYRVGAGPVRALLAMLPTSGAQGSILVTSGRFDAAAGVAARDQPITLLDGEALWHQVSPLLPTEMLDEVDRRSAEAMARANSRARAAGLLGIASLLVAGLLAYVGDQHHDAATPAAMHPEPAAGTVSTVRATAATPVETPTPVETATPVKTPTLHSEEHLEQQRSLAAAESVLVPGVAAARWESQSTLELAILDEPDNDSARARITEAVCARLLQREALRYSRVKVVRFGAAARAAPRWHQCR